MRGIQLLLLCLTLSACAAQGATPDSNMASDQLDLTPKTQVYVEPWVYSQVGEQFQLYSDQSYKFRLMIHNKDFASSRIMFLAVSERQLNGKLEYFLVAKEPGEIDFPKRNVSVISYLEYSAEISSDQIQKLFHEYRMLKISPTPYDKSYCDHCLWIRTDSMANSVYTTRQQIESNNDFNLDSAFATHFLELAGEVIPDISHWKGEFENLAPNN